MSESRRFFRKALAANGLIFLAGEELEIVVQNFSVTGLLIELLNNPIIQDIGDLFRTIESVSTIVDIYLPEMRLAGEVRIIRADMEDDHFLLALEFVRISYDVDAVFYKRRVYRKALEAFGSIAINGRKLTFKTINVSVEGLMVAIDVKLHVESGLVTAFEFEYLNLLGEVEVVWVEDDPNGGTLMGLHYLRVNKHRIKGIPRFAQAGPEVALAFEEF